MKVGSFPEITALVAKPRRDVCCSHCATTLPVPEMKAQSPLEETLPRKVEVRALQRQQPCRYGSSLEAVHERHLVYSDSELLSPEPHPQKNPYRRTDKPVPHFVSIYA